MDTISRKTLKTLSGDRCGIAKFDIKDHLKNKSNQLFQGILLLLIGALMLGGSGIFVKVSDSSPSLIAFYRALLALPFCSYG